MTPCTIKIQEHHDIIIVALHGNLLNADVPKVIETCKQVLASGFRKVIFDVSDLMYVDENGLTGIISSYRNCCSVAGKFVLYCPQADLKARLETTKLDSIIPHVYGELIAAINLVNAQ